MPVRPILLVLLVAALAGCRNGGTSAAIEECVPGETLVVGCAASCGIGRCEGDPVLRICDGALGLGGCGEAATGMFVDTDDSCSSLCPRTRVVCPASGSIAVLTRGIGSGRYLCEWEAEHRGILPPGGRAGETISCTAGAPVEVGCSLACGVGECDGNASLRVCDGTVPVADCVMGSTVVLRETSSSSGCDTRCPQFVVTCPPSGSLTVVPRNTSFGGGSDDYWCEWQAVPAPNRAGATEVCSPGQRYFVGCAAGCGMGSCEGDGNIRACDGNVTPAACLAITDVSMTLGQSNRSSCDGDCPQLAVACPASGALTVVSFSSYEDEGFGCDWTMRPAGIGE